MRLFAGLDLGTGGCRCLVLDEDGARVGYGERGWAYGLDAHGLAALDPSAALAAARGALADAAGACQGGQIAALGVCSQRTGVVFCDADGDEVLISPNTDARGVTHGVEQERAHGEAIWRITGRAPAIIHLPARLAWMREHEPRAVASVLSLSDWLVWRMTGVRGTEPTQAAEMLCLDLARGTWSEELMERLAVPRALLPDIAEAGTVAGELVGGWSLPAGTPVVAAGADTQCAALGAGATEPGAAVVVAGTTMLAGRVIGEPAIDPDGRVWTSPAAMAGRWLHEAHCADAGAFLAWFADLMGTDPEGLDALAARGRPGAGGAQVVGPLAGSARDFPLLRTGALTFPAPVIALGRPREDVARAAFEGVAFAAREGLSWLAARDGQPAAVVVTGGVARSSVFLAALAGALEHPIRATNEHASSARGAAIAAAAAARGFDEAVAAMHDAGHQVAPVASDGYPAHDAAWRTLAGEVRAKAVTMRGLMS